MCRNENFHIIRWINVWEFSGRKQQILANLYTSAKNSCNYFFTFSILSDSKSEDLIAEHHSLYIDRFSLPLKPKHHILIHYPRIMKIVRPIITLSSLRLESKHRETKMLANEVSSRVNNTYTLAVQHQLK